MTLSYSNVCPAPQEFSLQNLVFWSMGFGGWMGVGILPIIWSSTEHPVIRFVLSFLSPGVCAFVMTAVFLAFYGVSFFIRSMAEIMTHPTFLVSGMGTIVLAIISIAFYISIRMGNHLDVLENSTNSVEQESSDSDTQEDNDSQEDDSSHASSTDMDEDKDDKEDVGNADNSWRSTANFEGLRNASPIQE